QSKLLNVLQERSLYRIGGTVPVTVEARVIAATNENLEQAVKGGSFREDLYYRLNVVRIECPPLRYRKKDIAPLARHFFAVHIRKADKPLLQIDPAVYDALAAYDWPGNVRELENAVESAVVLCDGPVLLCEDLPLRVQNSTHPADGALHTTGGELSLKEQEMMAIISALEKHNGHREKTAAELGISRRALQYKLKRLNLG
ncbi:MAG: sigma 54-interacting transcriptional regulator, partial [Oscillospiraceae bacterium]